MQRLIDRSFGNVSICQSAFWKGLWSGGWRSSQASRFEFLVLRNASSLAGQDHVPGLVIVGVWVWFLTKDVSILIWQRISCRQSIYIQIVFRHDVLQHRSGLGRPMIGLSLFMTWLFKIVAILHHDHSPLEQVWPENHVPCEIKGRCRLHCFFPSRTSSVACVESTLRRLPEPIHEAACFSSCFSFAVATAPSERLRRHLLCTGKDRADP
jgi:hypothetical protein